MLIYFLYKFHSNISSAPANIVRRWERESGVSPERSGHCEQGVMLKVPLAFCWEGAAERRSVSQESPVGSIVPQGMRRRADCWSVSQETCLYVVRLKLPSKVLHPVCSKNEMSAFCRGKDIFFIYLQKHELMEWSKQERSVSRPWLFEFMHD